MTKFKHRGATAGFIAAAALAIAPVAAMGQGNSPGNRKCPQGQVPQGNSGYCIPNPGQQKKESSKTSKQSLGGGVYRNLADDNPREGRKFRIVKRGGNTYHVYPGVGCKNVKGKKGKTRKVCKRPREVVLVEG